MCKTYNLLLFLRCGSDSSEKLNEHIAWGISFSLFFSLYKTYLPEIPFQVERFDFQFRHLKNAPYPVSVSIVANLCFLNISSGCQQQLVQPSFKKCWLVFCTFCTFMTTFALVVAPFSVCSSVCSARCVCRLSDGHLAESPRVCLGRDRVLTALPLPGFIPFLLFHLSQFHTTPSCILKEADMPVQSA